MKPLKHRPKKGLAAYVDDQCWRLESQTDYAKALLLMREYVIFYKNGEPHREDGPAIIQVDGSKFWRLNGKRHREDGPTIIYADGSELWYLNGLRHRVDGPAIVWASGKEEWYLKGKLIT